MCPRLPYEKRLICRCGLAEMISVETKPDRGQQLIEQNYGASVLTLKYTEYGVGQPF